jgi:hypothetical protein
MIDYFALTLSHGLLFLAGWQLMLRADLDQDPAKAEPPQPEPPRSEAPQPALPGPHSRA